MEPSRRRIAALACALALVPGLVLATGCGEEDEGEAHREGLALELGGLTYNVFITRQLNLRDPEDRGYFQGPEAPPGSSYYGVFIQVCNEEDEPAPAAGDIKIVDTQGNEYFPVKLPKTNLFAYQPREVRHNRCIPEEGSTAATGPTAGALLLFRLTTQAVENRPLELEIRRPGPFPPQELLNAEPVESETVPAPEAPSEPAKGDEEKPAPEEVVPPEGEGEGSGATGAGAGGGQEGSDEVIRIELDI